MSKAYYNEFDPKAAAWLRELIKAGHIADGIVDERSITEVRADDLMGFAQCHFFAGIGGWSYALRLAGVPDDYPVWTGSCPCQPFSVIGKRKGTDDERHLWPEFKRLIAEKKPTRVFGEQVASSDGREWLSGVRADLEVLGYETGCADLCAAGVSAPHIRQRLYWVGNSISERLEGHDRNVSAVRKAEKIGSDTETSSGCNQSSSMDALSMLRRNYLHHTRMPYARVQLPTDRGMGANPIRPWEQFDALPCSDGWRRIQSGTFPLAYGIPARVVRLRGYGNAIVPQVAAEFVSAFYEVMA